MPFTRDFLDLLLTLFDTTYVQPELYLIGGPNGAGKTTFAKELLPNELSCLRFYNSDEIAKGLSPFDSSRAQIQAGRILLSNLQRSIYRRESFALESTLSGHTYVNYLKKAKSAGFKLTLHFLWLPSADESWKRVEQRVQEGGHAVPKEAVFRRYPKILENVISLYAPLMDDWYIWDCSSLPVNFVGKSGVHPIDYYL